MISILVLLMWHGAGPVQMPYPHAALQQTLLYPPFLTPMEAQRRARPRASGRQNQLPYATHGLPITANHAVCTLGLSTD